ncbi:MAG: hypothetical protein KZQ75_06075, partial [Candidatus Thiodiazotropha sp. (ex Myrtea spinifera)]|nr:hypothetical protein [Candidatus Thiodiazotropha sp. (ex Myrtea spinifera)]
KPVITRAKQRLRELELSAQQHADQQQTQMPLFDLKPCEPELSAVESLLQEIEPDELTPREALDQLYKLKQQLKTSE